MNLAKQENQHITNEKYGKPYLAEEDYRLKQT